MFHRIFARCQNVLASTKARRGKNNLNRARNTSSADAKKEQEWRCDAHREILCWNPKTEIRRRKNELTIVEIFRNGTRNTLISVRPVPKREDKNEKREELSAALRELMGLDRQRQELDDQINQALQRADNVGIAKAQLEANRKNVLCRFDHTRGYIDSEIARAMADISLDGEFQESNTNSLGRSPGSSETSGSKKKRLPDPSINDLTSDEHAFLKVLVTGESNMCSGRYGLRVADLQNLLVTTEHAVSKTADIRKATIAMLKDLEGRGYAFRTGPSLHRVRRHFITAVT